MDSPRSLPRDAPDPEPEARIRRLTVLGIVAFFAVDGLLRTGYFHFGARAQDSTKPFADALISEMTGSFATLFVFFGVVLPVSRRWPVRGERWLRNLGVHALALLVFSGVKTTLMWGLRAVLFPAAGLGAYDYGDLAYRYPMELSNDVIGYLFLAIAVHAFDAWSRLRERELREARLEARLGEARLQALQGQLRPHFLFNTLNAVSSVMYRDPERADRLLARLSDLLRWSLSAPQRPEVPVEEEVQALEQYLEIMRARFEGLLQVDVRVDDEAREAAVPLFVLQPLVENALTHGAGERATPGRVEVRVERRGGRLRLTVADDGPGLSGDPAAALTRGVGLSNTRERLDHLYGDGASLRLENRPSGGLRAVVELPFRPCRVAPSEPARV